MLALGGFNFSLVNFWLVIKNIFKSPYILIGIGFYGLGFLLCFFVLSKMKLSIVYPFTALNIVLITLISHFFQGMDFYFTVGEYCFNLYRHYFVDKKLSVAEIK